MERDEFQRIILNSGSSFKFLAADEGKWLGVDDNGDEREYYIEDMSKTHKQNCIKYLNKHRKDIERGFFLQSVEYKESDYKELVRIACESMDEKLRALSE